MRKREREKERERVKIRETEKRRWIPILKPSFPLLTVLFMTIRLYE